MKFFLGADHGLDIPRLLAEIASPEGLSEEMQDACSMLSNEQEECAEGIAEGVACGQGDQAIYAMECASEIMDQDEGNEALSLAIFEGGSLNPDLRVLSIALA